MIRRRDLLGYIVTTLQAVPQVVADVGGDPTNIFAYIDNEVPKNNSRARAIYQQPPGTLMVYWEESLIGQGEIPGWIHTLIIFYKADNSNSPLDVMDDVTDGRSGGQALPWRCLCLTDDLLPVKDWTLSWTPDTEGIDYHSIKLTIQEKLDTGVSPP